MLATARVEPALPRLTEWRSSPGKRGGDPDYLQTPGVDFAPGVESAPGVARQGSFGPPDKAHATSAAAPGMDAGASSDVYKIKRVEFFGRKQVPIVMQNQNGPCPLIAISNVLLLRNAIAIVPEGLPEISVDRLLSLVVERLLDSNASTEGKSEQFVRNQHQNMSDAISVVNRLATGIDVNVKFGSVFDFEFTPETAIFDLLDISLVHGWLVDPQDKATLEAVGSQAYNSLVELVLAHPEAMAALSAAYGGAGGEDPGKAECGAESAAVGGGGDERRAEDGAPQQCNPAAALPLSLWAAEDAAGPGADGRMGGASAAECGAPAEAALGTRGAGAGQVAADEQDESPLGPFVLVGKGSGDACTGGGEAAVRDLRGPHGGTSGQVEAGERLEWLGQDADGGVLGRESTGVGEGAEEARDRSSDAAAVAGVVAGSGSGEKVGAGTGPEAVAGAGRKPGTGSGAGSGVGAGPEAGAGEGAGLETGSGAGAGNGPDAASELRARQGAVPGGPELSLAPDGSDAAIPVAVEERAAASGGGVGGQSGPGQVEGGSGPGPAPERERLREALLVSSFLTETASQLTVHGLFSLQESLRDQQLCVFFRNNHFSTLFKREGKLYLLVTDQGYLSQPGVVWEQLGEVEGNNQFFSGDFTTFVAASDGDVSEPQWSVEDDAAIAAAVAADLDGYAQAPVAQGAGFNSDLQLAFALQQQEEAAALRAMAKTVHPGDRSADSAGRQALPLTRREMAHLQQTQAQAQAQAQMQGAADSGKGFKGAPRVLYSQQAGNATRTGSSSSGSSASGWATGSWFSSGTRDYSSPQQQEAPQAPGNFQHHRRAPSTQPRRARAETHPSQQQSDCSIM